MIANDDLTESSSLVTPATSPDRITQTFSISAEDIDSDDDRVYSVPRDTSKPEAVEKPATSVEPITKQGRHGRKSKRASPKQPKTSQ
jgi:hypothetical protein